MPTLYYYRNRIGHSIPSPHEPVEIIIIGKYYYGISVMNDDINE